MKKVVVKSTVKKGIAAKPKISGKDIMVTVKLDPKIVFEPLTSPVPDERLKQLEIISESAKSLLKQPAQKKRMTDFYFMYNEDAKTEALSFLVNLQSAYMSKAVKEEHHESLINEHQNGFSLLAALIKAAPNANEML